MTASNHIYRALALAAVGFSAASVGHAQTFDLDACTGGTKTASGYTGCGTGTAAHGTVTVKALTSNGVSTNFSATSLNDGGTYIGVLSGTETSGTGSPHHAIDNFGSPGNSYELVHLQFSKAVDLGTLVAQWANDTATGDADFQVYRWNYNATTTNPNVTTFNPSSMTGWALVHTGDFDSSPGTGGGGGTGLSQSITDTSYFSSHWLITTAFGGSNDAFKLGSLTAAAVCSTSQTSTGGCAPGTVPEPATLAMVLLAGVGATAARRRRRD